MHELRIFDKSKNENLIIPIRNLIKIMESIIPNIFNALWSINKCAYGYGERVCSIEDELNYCNEIEINGEDIFPILKSGEEYFYNVCLNQADADIQFGVFDSTFLFIRSNNIFLLKKVQSSFNNTRIIEK
jgi:hypothetical protein